MLFKHCKCQGNITSPPPHASGLHAWGGGNVEHRDPGIISSPMCVDCMHGMGGDVGHHTHDPQTGFFKYNSFAARNLVFGLLLMRFHVVIHIITKFDY
jgi:hypothetical protein